MGVTVQDVAITDREHLPRAASTLRLASVAALILLIPYNIHFDVLVDTHSPHLVGSGVQSTWIGPIDALFAIVILSCLPLLSRRSTYLKQPIGQMGSAVFIAVVAIWLTMYPTVEGSMMLLRVAGVFAVIIAVRAMSKKDFLVGVVGSLTLGASLQALLALSQTFMYDSGMVVAATRSAVGRAWTAGRGTFGGNYTLAAYLIFAIAVALSFGISKRPLNRHFDSISLSAPLRVSMWTAVALSSAAVATSFGRTALLAIGLVGGAYVVGWLMHRNQIMGISALMTLLPLAATGIVLRSGWLVRASQSATFDLTTRDALAARALEMIRSSPLTGIGPVQYGPNLTQMGLSVLDPHIVHNVPLLVTAEFGIVVGVAFTIWLATLGVRAFRLSIYAAALYLAILPFLLLDNLHYVYGNGMAMFAIWIATLDYHRDAATGPATDQGRPQAKAS